MIETNYRAFISYNHKDREKAVWLQRRLEAYRVPRKLVDVLTSEGSVPRRLSPIFRDEECMAAGDLSDGVKDALKHSRFLIVVCSPDGAASEWVDREVRLFKEMHGAAGERRVLCAVVRGAPDEAEGAPLDPAGLLPRACVFRLGADGALTDVPVEPLAADLRFSDKHAKKGLLKLVSGLIGVGLDDLLDRDHRRKQNYMRSVAGLASAVAALTGGLAWVAVDARNEARRQRNEAEGLVEFMLTDLKAKLDAVGRLDALESVGARALQYYAAQDKGALDADSLGRRARAQLLVGEIDNLRGDLDAALRAYEEAASTTDEQLRRDPGNGQRIFDHAQSVFWVGYVAWQRGDLKKAETFLKEYGTLADRLIAIDADRIEWRKEKAYAHNNLGSLYLKSGRRAEAIAEFEQALAVKSDIARDDPSDVSAGLDRAQSYSWLGSAWFEEGRFAESEASFRSELEIYDALASRGVQNADALRASVTAQIYLAQTKLFAGDNDAALSLVQSAHETIERLLDTEPANTFWLTTAVKAHTMCADLAQLRGDAAGAVHEIGIALGRSESLLATKDPRPGWRRADARLRLAALGLGPQRAIAEQARRAHQIYRSYAAQQAFPAQGEHPFEDAQLAAAYGEFLAASDPDAASERRRHALNLLLRNATKNGPPEEMLMLRLLIELRDATAARKLIERLDAQGVRHPAMVAMRASLESLQPPR
jgi:tetratricopeptide (TPR) repeat protein